MSNTNRALNHEHTGRSQQTATRNSLAELVNASGLAELVDAYAGMATGISRPQSVKWRLDDANRKRSLKPLGSYPEVAEAVAEAGGSFFHISRPLNVMLAHLRRRCVGKLPGDMKSALLSVKKECDEAQSCGLNVALTLANPEPSTLLALIKEEHDAIIAEEKLVEIAEDILQEKM